MDPGTRCKHIIASGKTFGIIGIELFATPFDFNSVDFLDELKVPYYKIASADLTNIPLQKYIAKKTDQDHEKYFLFWMKLSETSRIMNLK